MTNEFEIEGGKPAEFVEIPNGEHFGVVQDVTKSEPDAQYQYFTLEIAMEDVKTPHDTPVILRYSIPVPKKATVDNKFGRTLLSMKVAGAVDESGSTKYNIKSLLLGKRCKFITKNKPSKKDPEKKYAEIIDLIEAA